MLNHRQSDRQCNILSDILEESLNEFIFHMKILKSLELKYITEYDGLYASGSKNIFTSYNRQHLSSLLFFNIISQIRFFLKLLKLKIITF